MTLATRIHRGVAENGRNDLLFGGEIPPNKDLPAPPERFFAEGQRLIENRYPPDSLLKNILLSDLCVSNESCFCRTNGR